MRSYSTPVLEVTPQHLQEAQVCIYGMHAHELLKFILIKLYSPDETEHRNNYYNIMGEIMIKLSLDIYR